MDPKSAPPPGILFLGNNRFIVDFKTIEFDSAAKAELTQYINKLGLDRAKDIQLITPDDIRNMPFEEQVKVWQEIRRSSEAMLIERYLEIPNKPVDGIDPAEASALKRKFGIPDHQDNDLIPVRTHEHGSKLSSIEEFRALNPEQQAEVWQDVQKKTGYAMSSLRQSSLSNIIEESSKAIRESKPFRDYVDRRSEIARSILEKHADALAKWDSTTRWKREELLEKINADLSKETGIPDVKIEFADHLSPGEGAYNYNNKKIYLPVPENGPEGVGMTFMNVTIHEFMHAEQDHIVQQLKEGKIKPGDQNYELAKLLEANHAVYVNATDQSASYTASEGKRYYNDLNDTLGDIQSKGGDPTKHMSENMFEQTEANSFRLYQMQPLETSVSHIAESACIDHVIARTNNASADGVQPSSGKKLSVNNISITPAGVEHLLTSPHMKDVTALELKGNAFSNMGLEMLAKSPLLSQIRELDLESNGIQNRGIAALVASPHAGNLETLNLSGNFFDDEGIKSLASSPHLKNLKHLSLEGVYIIEDGARALADSPHLSAEAKVSALHSIGQSELADAVMKQHTDTAHVAPKKEAQDQQDISSDTVEAETAKKKPAPDTELDGDTRKRVVMPQPAALAPGITDTKGILTTGTSAAQPEHFNTPNMQHTNAPAPKKPNALGTLGNVGNRGMGIAGTATGAVEGIATGDPGTIATSALDVADTVSDFTPEASRVGQVLRGVGTIAAPLAIVGGVTQMADGASRMGNSNTVGAGAYTFGLGAAGTTAGVATVVGAGGLASTLSVILVPVALADYGMQRARGNLGNDDSKPWETSMSYALRKYDEAVAVRDALSREGVTGQYATYGKVGLAPPSPNDYYQLSSLDIRPGQSVDDAIQNSRNAAVNSWNAAYEEAGKGELFSHVFFADHKKRAGYDATKDLAERRIKEMESARKEYEGESAIIKQILDPDIPNPHAGQIKLGRFNYVDSYKKREARFETAKKEFEEAGPRSKETWDKLQDMIAVSRGEKPSDAAVQVFDKLKEANGGKDLTVDQKMSYISNQVLYARAMEMAKGVQTGEKPLKDMIAEDQKVAKLLKKHGGKLSGYFENSLLITSEEQLEKIARVSWEGQRKLAEQAGQDPDKVIPPNMKEAFGIEPPLLAKRAELGSISSGEDSQKTISIRASKDDVLWLKSQGIEGKLDGEHLRLEWDKIKDRLPDDISDKLIRHYDGEQARIANEERLRKQIADREIAKAEAAKAEAAATKVASRRVQDVLNGERADAYRQIIRTMHAEKKDSFQITDVKDESGNPTGKIRLTVSGRKGYDFDQPIGAGTTDWARENPEGHVIDELIEQRKYSDVAILKNLFNTLENRENFPAYKSTPDSMIMYYDESVPDNGDGRNRRHYGNAFTFELDPSNPDHMKGLAKLFPEDVYNQVMPPELLKQHPYPKGVKWEFEERFELIERLKTQKVTPASFDLDGDGVFNDKEKTHISNAHRMLRVQAKDNGSLEDVVKQVAEIARANGVELSLETSQQLKMPNTPSSEPTRPYNAPYSGR